MQSNANLYDLIPLVLHDGIRQLYALSRLTVKPIHCVTTRLLRVIYLYF